MRKSLLVLMFALLFSANSFAQEVSVGSDFVSQYVWRGLAYGGPSVQPSIELSAGDFAIGAWGSFDLLTGGPAENDFYMSYSVGDLSIGLTDYYYQGPLFEFDDVVSSHAFEANLGYTIDNLSLGGNFIFNDASMGAGSVGSDMYFEVGYSFGILDAFVGAGDGWHSSDTEFALVNIGISASKEIKVTDDFSLPMFGSIVVNPDAEVSYLFVGFSL